VPKIGNALENICQSLQKRFVQIKYINRLGAALSLDIADESGTPDSRMAHWLVEIGLRGDISVAGESMGIVMTAGGGLGNMIMLAPSLNMSGSSFQVYDVLLREAFARATQ
jgi:hypothetical protein